MFSFLKPTVILALIAALAIGSVPSFFYGQHIGAEGVKNEQNAESLKQHKEAIAEAVVGAKAMATAATGQSKSQAALVTDLNSKIKELNNAKALPVDCRPDDDRVRNLIESIEATNKSTTGQQPR